NEKTHDLNSLPNDEDSMMKSQMERMVSSYDSYMRKITLGRENTLREMTVNLARVKPGDWVLEVGCGTGTLTLAAKRQAGASGKVFGIDIIPGMIDLSQQKAAQSQLDVTFQLGSIEEIPFPANQFDVVMCSFMIFHMSEEVRRKGIAEIYRVLKPQGQFMALDLALPSRPVSKALAKIFLGFMLEHDLQELVPLMEAAGFSGSEVLPVKYRVLGLPILAYTRGRKVNSLKYK
ncbi:MAG TPA: methyltransferase domain-containing protein, partial [Bacillota bacterium]|nr:methyltransferase domain-containing protein [Bacillota bacterium]